MALSRSKSVIAHKNSIKRNIKYLYKVTLNKAKRGQIKKLVYTKNCPK